LCGFELSGKKGISTTLPVALALGGNSKRIRSDISASLLMLAPDEADSGGGQILCAADTIFFSTPGSSIAHTILCVTLRTYHFHVRRDMGRCQWRAAESRRYLLNSGVIFLEK